MQEKKRVSRHIFLLPCRAAGRARNAMTHDQIPPHLLATLEPGDRALFEERTDNLTSDQAFRRQELAAQINLTHEIASESREARDSRIIAERCARDIPAMDESKDKRPRMTAASGGYESHMTYWMVPPLIIDRRLRARLPPQSWIFVRCLEGPGIASKCYTPTVTDQ